MINKVAIILNTIFPIIAFIQLNRAMYRSYMMEIKLNRIHKGDMEKMGLLYLLAEDKMLYQKLSRIILSLLLTANFLLFSWSVTRILDNFAAYVSTWRVITAVIFHAIMAIVAHCVFLIYNQSSLTFLKTLDNPGTIIKKNILYVIKQTMRRRWNRH